MEYKKIFHFSIDNFHIFWWIIHKIDQNNIKISFESEKMSKKTLSTFVWEVRFFLHILNDQKFSFVENTDEE